MRRLEDSAPWIDQRVSLAVDNEAFTKLLGSQMVVDFAESSLPARMRPCAEECRQLNLPSPFPLSDERRH